jgi:hypothetical protein
MKPFLLPTLKTRFNDSTQLDGLKNLYKRKRLTACLELLEQCGLQGDEAIFILSNLGGEG